MTICPKCQRLIPPTYAGSLEHRHATKPLQNSRSMSGQSAESATNAENTPQPNAPFPPTRRASEAGRTGESVMKLRTVDTKYGKKAILTLESGTDFWATPYMLRKLGMVADPITVKKAATRVSVPPRVGVRVYVESYPTTQQTGYKLVERGV